MAGNEPLEGTPTVLCELGVGLNVVVEEEVDIDVPRCREINGFTTVAAEGQAVTSAAIEAEQVILLLPFRMRPKEARAGIVTAGGVAVPVSITVSGTVRNLGTIAAGAGTTVHFNTLSYRL
jgi:hypothetical protein